MEATGPFSRREWIVGTVAWLSVACASRRTQDRASRAPGRARQIETVTGPVAADRLGVTLMHEHVLVDFIGAAQVSPSRRFIPALKAEGFADFSMVHDSYAVHASDVDRMNRVLREQFVRVHTEFSLDKFLEQVKVGASGIRFTKRLAPPAQGTLDLAEVVRSEYFFS